MSVSVAIDAHVKEARIGAADADAGRRRARLAPGAMPDVLSGAAPAPRLQASAMNVVGISGRAGELALEVGASSAAWITQMLAQDSGGGADVEPWMAADAYRRLDRPANVTLDLVPAV